jgi:hypothetical protein
MQYMLLIYNAPDAGPQRDSPEFMPKRAEWGEYTAKLQEAGVHVAGDPLEPTTDATTVRVRNGDRVITDGPFAETKEWLVGYYLIDTPDLDSALEWAAQMPNITYGSVEVRPVWDYAASMA